VSGIDSTGVSDVMVTVDLAEEPTPSQFHTTVVVHSSLEPSPGLSYDEAVDVISTSTSELSVSEETVGTTPHEPADVDEEGIVTSMPVVTSSNVPPSTSSEAATSMEAAATASLPDPRPRAPFGRRPSSRSQALAQDTSAGSTPLGVGQHVRSNNEMAHSAVMDALFRRHSKAEAAASAAHRQQQESNTRTTSSSNQSSGSSSSMSVSVPNLTSTMEQTVSLLETFAMVARRNLGNNSGSVMSAVTGSNNNPCSSLVRLALSSNSPGTSCTFFYLVTRMVVSDCLLCLGVMC